MRLAALPEVDRRAEPVRCEVCERPTREGKPRCSEHVEQLPHARLVAERLAADEAERAKVTARGWKAVDPRGVMVGEIVRALEELGPRTITRLQRQFQLAPELAKSYVEALRRRRLVVISRTRRGKAVAQLAEGWGGALMGWLEEQVERAQKGRALAPPPGRTEWKDPRSEALLRHAIKELSMAEPKSPPRGRRASEWRAGLSAQVLREWRGERSYAWASAQLQSCEASVRNWEGGVSVPSQIKQDLIESLVNGKPLPAAPGDLRAELARALRRVADELEGR